MEGAASWAAEPAARRRDATLFKAMPDREITDAADRQKSKNLAGRETPAALRG
jgi:hypothetical protein